MLRINLLPSYVSQRRLTKRLVVAFAALFILCVLAPLAIYASMVHHLNDVSAQADSAEAGKKITDARKAQAAAAIASIKPIQDKLDFVTAVHAYNRQQVALYNTLADTSPKSSLIYTDASYSASTMSIKAYSPSVGVVGRYLQAMYQEPDFQTVTVDKVPGYPDNVRHLYYLNGKMVFADGATGSTGGGGQQGSQSSSQGRGQGGFPGGGPGGGGSPSGGYGGGQSGSSIAPAGYTLANLGPNGPTNLPAGVGPPPAELTGGATASAQGGGQGGAGQGSGAGQAGGYSPAFLAIADRNLSPFILPEAREAIHRQFLRRVVMVSAPKGFDINVTATLKQPLTAPTLPGSAPAAGAGRGAGFGGPMGGSPGGPMGGSPGGPMGGPPSGPPAGSSG